MCPKFETNPATRWSIGEIKQGPEVVGASIEMYLTLEEHYQPLVRYRFQYNRRRDPVGPIHIPGRFGSSAEDKATERDNRAAFEAARAVAEETGTRVKMYVHSQEYLNSISRESLDGLIEKLGEEEARQLLEEGLEE